ncbi:hypothetical protein KJ909_01915 [Patescibacteria group bacterium]|nr:hypothetical protein [Patescibacteria group bacterium]
MERKEFYAIADGRTFYMPERTRTVAVVQEALSWARRELETRLAVARNAKFVEERWRLDEKNEADRQKKERWEQAIVMLEETGVPDLLRDWRDKGILRMSDDPVFDYEQASGLRGILGDVIKKKIEDFTPAKLVFDGEEGVWVELNFSVKDPLTLKRQSKSFRVSFGEEGLMIGEEVIPGDRVVETIVSRLAEVAS